MAVAWFRPPRHLLALFFTIALVLSAALGWLVWRLVEQDRDLERQHLEERLDQSADVIAGHLLRRIAEFENELARLSTLTTNELGRSAPAVAASDLPSDGALVVIRGDLVEVYPPGRLLYSPSVKPVPSSAPVFASGERLEFQEKDAAAAAEVYRRLAGSSDRRVRAGALLRLGRSLRKLQQLQAASEAYQKLAQMHSITIDAIPADLVGRYGYCLILSEVRDATRLRREASDLLEALYRGRWRLEQSAFRFYEREAHHWLASSGPPSQLAPDPRLSAIAAGVEALWDEYRRSSPGINGGEGRRPLRANGLNLLLIWRTTAEGLVGFVLGRDSFGRSAHRGSTSGIEFALVEQLPPVNRSVATSAPPRTVRTLAELQLPWGLQLTSSRSVEDLRGQALRQRLLLVSVGLVALLLVISAYFLARAATRELEVARLKSDFVATVSHEFRTPLASLRQLSEMLADHRVVSEERRQQYYDQMRRQSERLQQLIDNLLDFRKIEERAKQYRLEPLDPVAFVTKTADEFAREARDRGYSVEVSVPEQLPTIRAEEETLGRALWNLLDNAVKYSPDCATVWVEAAKVDEKVEIRVRDRGLGISPSEQKAIFSKFTRASSARASGAPGSGLGLAMVREIMAAHGGTVRVDSNPTAGTTFTISLPAEGAERESNPHRGRRERPRFRASG